MNAFRSVDSGAGGIKLGYLFAALLAMAGATAIGWHLAGTPPARPGEVVPRERLAILPFDDPGIETDDIFNRALAEAFVVALTGADPQSLVVIGPTITAQMMAAGLTPAEVASRTGARFVLSGGHRESDHSTLIQLFTAPDGEQLFSRRFEVNASAPAIADGGVVDEIVAAIKQRSAPNRGGRR